MNFERHFTLLEKIIAMLTQELDYETLFSMFLCGLIFYLMSYCVFINYTQRFIIRISILKKPLQLERLFIAVKIISESSVFYQDQQRQFL